jgi:glycosyltransferase involved in cell wall biosynthesis
MKVIHVVASINRNVGGPAVTVARLASALAEMQVEATVATLDYAVHGPQSPVSGARLSSVPAGLATRRLRGWSPRLARNIAALTRQGAGIVHSHGLWMFPNLYARRAARGAGVPLVVSPRGMLDDWSLRRSRVRKFAAWNLFERENLSCAKLFHATCAPEARSVRAAGFTQPIAVIPNGVDLPGLSVIAPRGTLERRHPALAQRQWLLFMSRLHPKKGLTELVHAWHGLAPRFPQWQLLVAGPDLDGHGAEVRALVESLGIADRVTFAGMLGGEEKACALARAGLMVLPTHSENFGIVVAESLAHGTPVLTTHAAPWEELAERNCGWWIEDSGEALGRTLEAALAIAPAALREMGLRGRALVSERYAWEGVALQMKAVYLWICGAGPQPDCILEP